jgi:hypothetical protein
MEKLKYLVIGSIGVLIIALVGIGYMIAEYGFVAGLITLLCGLGLLKILEWIL